MIRLFLFFTCLFASVSCHSPGSPTTPQQLKGPFDGDFIPDAYPLSQSNPDDLGNIAATLDVFESSNVVVAERIRAGKGGRMIGDQWVLNSDGAQSALTIEKVPSGDNGATRIKARLGPRKVRPHVIWESVLERASGGWKVISQNQTEIKIPSY